VIPNGAPQPREIANEAVVDVAHFLASVIATQADQLPTGGAACPGHAESHHDAVRANVYGAAGT
jgi:hypothetical protein